MFPISVEDDAPPAVRAIANELAAGRDDPAFSEGTERTRGIVCLRDALTPQAVTVRIADGEIAVSRGEPVDADLTATVHFEDLAGSEPELAGAAEHEQLARWASSLVAEHPATWRDAAERFWTALREMPGAPAALVIVDLEAGDGHRFGSREGHAYEIRGRPRALRDVFVGRVPLLDAAFDGRVFVRGSFRELSLLTGACFAVRYGGVVPDA